MKSIEKAYPLALRRSVIDERYKSRKPFIITTNLSLEKLQNPADLEFGRIYDRIMERCIPVAFSVKITGLVKAGRTWRAPRAF